MEELSYLLSDVSFIIGGNQSFGDKTQNLICSNTINIFNKVGKKVKLEPNSGSHIIEKSQSNGEIAVVYSNSENLLLSIPTLFKVSQGNFPLVYHINAQFPSQREQLVYPDHSHIYAARQTGVAIINSRTRQEQYDWSLLAHLVSTQTGIPFLHFFIQDSLTQSDDQKIQPISNELLQKLFPFKTLEGLRIQNQPQQPEITKEKKEQDGENNEKDEKNEQQKPDLMTVIENYIEELKKNGIKSFQSSNNSAFEYIGSEIAESIIVTMASGSEKIEEIVRELVESGQSVGLLIIKIFRPWSEELLLKAIPKSVQKIAVLELTGASYSGLNSWGLLFMDIVASFNSKHSTTHHQNPFIIGGQYGKDGINVSKESIKSIFDNLSSPSPKSNFIIESKNEIEKVLNQHENENQDQNENEKDVGDISETPYLKMLHQVFADNVTISNATGYSTIWGKGTSEQEAKTILQNPSRLDEVGAEFGFGMYLAINQKREILAENIKSILNQVDSIGISEELKSLLTKWIQNKDNSKISNECSSKIIPLLPKETSKHPLLQELYLKKELLKLTSHWIVGGDDWAYDMNTSGIHHILTSEEKVNLLIIDTEPYSKTVGKGDKSSQRKKDIGLYAMNYGGAYVASIAIYSSYSQALRAFTEANDYPGPSIILAYLPKPEPDTDIKFPTSSTYALSILKESKLAVDTGYWPLYRWNPSLEDESSTPFFLDSQKIQKDVEEFLKKENQLSSIMKENPTFSDTLSGSNEKTLVEKHQQLREKATESFNKLFLGLKNAKPLLILYGSDGGNGEGLARRLESKAKTRLDTRCLAMDEYPVEELASEPTVCFIVSTAGQGEFPTNAREFWKTLSNSTDLNLSNTNIAIFSLGDSHYWPLPEDAIYFCKPGNDLDSKLTMLGAQRLLPIGIGDDQNEDGFETGFQPWETEFWKVLGIEFGEGEGSAPKPKSVEQIKLESNYLRGTIAQGLADESTGAIAESDTALVKFHGMYQQDDRDLREERRKQGKEKAYSFMIRVRVPGGISTPDQWLAIDEISDKYSNGNIKLTTRQAFQLHGIIKKNLKPTMREINKALMNTIAACGDVNRNVMCNPNPFQSEVHQEVQDFTQRLNDHLLPRTGAYHEIWLDDKLVAGNVTVERPVKVDEEPLYGKVYLPRKFKIAVAIPPNNDVDVLAHCLGFIAITENNKLVGFNVTVGGGMGMTHNNKKTFPRLADVMGFCTVEQGVEVGEKVMLVQRDYGDRSNRRHARLKYTVEDNGIDWYRTQVEERLGYKLQPARPYKFTDNSDRYGWTKGLNNSWHYCMFVQNGRVRDSPDYPLRTAIREIAKVHKGDFRLTPNQHLIIGNVNEKDKELIQSLLIKYKISNEVHSGLRLNSMACVALPTCGLAFAESERYLPDLIDKIDLILEKSGLIHEPITVRMTGCPNGCARPYVSEIGFVGKAPGVYNMYLGAGFSGERLNKIFKESVNEEQILHELNWIIPKYAKERLDGERFGDFVIRSGIVKACLQGNDFHS